jgi:Domain of unknown function (DUF4384)
MDAMNAKRLLGATLAAALALCAGPAGAASLGIELWTDRGSDAVYEPGDQLQVSARASEDTYLLVYEIDAEGAVNLLYPYRGSTGLIEGQKTYVLPPENSDVELVVQPSTGQCFIVAIASRDAFLDMPWYLRPYDMQADEMGYEGKPDEEEGITSDGKIVGDPYVAMERIRRRVLAHPDDASAFSTAYTTYYVHQEVKYPRYLCYDCHRPDHWAWWDGFDPYYATCSVFTFRVNWGWTWGPGYWFGTVPYYYYAYRPDCPPRYYGSGGCFSSWDGWRRWCSTWGGPLVRHKSSPPLGYVPPNRYRDSGSAPPPGLMSSNHLGSRGMFRSAMPIGRSLASRSEGQGGRGGIVRNGGVSRPAPVEGPGRQYLPRSGGATRNGDSPRVLRPNPAYRPREESRPWIIRPGQEAPSRQPRQERPTGDRPRYEAPQGRSDPPRSEGSGSGQPRYERPQGNGGGGGRARSEPSSGGGVRQGGGGRGAFGGRGR